MKSEKNEFMSAVVGFATIVGIFALGRKFGKTEAKLENLENKNIEEEES